MSVTKQSREKHFNATNLCHGVNHSLPVLNAGMSAEKRDNKYRVYAFTYPFVGYERLK